MVTKQIKKEITIRLKKDIFLSLKALSNLEGRTYSGMIHTLMESYMTNGEMKR